VSHKESAVNRNFPFLSLRHQPHKVQHETYALRFGSRTLAGSATTP
jgi:hypothetical protein